MLQRFTLARSLALAMLVTGVLVIAVVVQAQNSFRSQVADRVVDRVADRVAQDLLAGEPSTTEPTVGGGFSNPPIQRVLLGTLTQDNQNSNTSTVTTFFLETSTDNTTRRLLIPDGYDSGVIQIDAVASSSVAELDIMFQQSWNNDDWYALRTATTSGAFQMIQPTASTTIGYIPGATTRRTASYSLPAAVFDAPWLKFWFVRGADGAVVPANFELFVQTIIRDKQ